MNLTLILDKLPERILFGGLHFRLTMTKREGEYSFAYLSLGTFTEIFISEHPNPENAAYMLHQKLVKEKLI